VRTRALRKSALIRALQMTGLRLSEFTLLAPDVSGRALKRTWSEVEGR
jgi:hypothetical protein